MAAPYTIEGDGEYFRNIESESATSVVWYQGNTYTFESYIETLEENLTYRGDGTPIFEDHYETKPVGPLDTAGGVHLILRQAQEIDPFLIAGATVYAWNSVPNTPGTFGYLISSSTPFAVTAEPLAAADFFDDIIAVIDTGETESVVPGKDYGGTGSWRGGVVVIGSSSTRGTGYIQSHKTYANLDGVPSGGITYQDNDSGNLTVSVLAMIGAAQFPVDRPDDYNEDQVWDPTADGGAGAWTSDLADLTTLGGGSYKEHLVVLGHKKIYFGTVQ